MPKIERIGILGGTFNPVHLGHLVLAEQARQLLRLKEVIFVPTNLPPHKRKRHLAAAKDRYRMLSLAVKSNLSFAVSDLELERGGISYSIETMKKFKSLFPQANLYFIVGSDFLEDFLTWKDIDKLRRICKIVVAPRPGHPIKKLPRNMQIIKVNALDITSSDIRRRIKTKASIRYLIPEEVRKYILKKGLYR
ncbi:MAG: nicotinate-nucleotide adenylyltransferase [Candidatus Omnitrophica bacterium]|nr:nicotinate-nucleotide adenylyltransferase [Candidatus Omnitrophota bacterium]